MRQDTERYETEDGREVNYTENKNGLGRWTWELSQEDWDRLYTYLATVDGLERWKTYQRIAQDRDKTGQIPDDINDIESIQKQWDEDCLEAGISRIPPLAK